MLSAESTPDESNPVSLPIETPPIEEEINQDAQDSTENEDSGVIFQAVGVITGTVDIGEDGKNFVTVGRSKYQLFYIPSKRKVFDALKKEIETTGDNTLRLVVYPKIIHFPRKEKLHQMAFQLVGFDRGRQQEAVSKELEDLEFKFSDYGNLFLSVKPRAFPFLGISPAKDWNLLNKQSQSGK